MVEQAAYNSAPEVFCKKLCDDLDWTILTNGMDCGIDDDLEAFLSEVFVAGQQAGAGPTGSDSLEIPEVDNVCAPPPMPTSAATQFAMQQRQAQQIQAQAQAHAQAQAYAQAQAQAQFSSSSSSSSTMMPHLIYHQQHLQPQSHMYSFPPRVLAAQESAAPKQEVQFIQSATSAGASAHDDCAGSVASESACSVDSSTGRKIYYRRSWTPAEDQMLIKLVEAHGPTHWSKLAASIPGKSGNQCSQRWCKALDPSIKKGKWSPEEDEALRCAVQRIGTKWKAISRLIPGRTGKQCRDRYTARLNPALTTGRWTPEEEAIALSAYEVHGNKWATIQKALPHRSWYTIKWKIESLTKTGSADASSNSSPAAAPPS